MATEPGSGCERGDSLRNPEPGQERCPSVANPHALDQRGPLRVKCVGIRLKRFASEGRAAARDAAPAPGNPEDSKAPRLEPETSHGPADHGQTTALTPEDGMALVRTPER